MKNRDNEEIRVDNRLISEDKLCFIIVEAGSNHGEK